MKRLIILLTIGLVLFNCSVKKKPQFVSLENIKVVGSTSKHVILSADALFINPNDIRGELKTDEIKVLMNDTEIGTVSSENFKVPAKKEFTIPLKAYVSKDSLFSNKSLDGFIGSLFSNKVKVQYKGDIIYSAFGFSHTYNINKTEDLKIKL